jgi:hypothetical protein
MFHLQVSKSGTFCRQSKSLEGGITLTFGSSISEEEKSKNLFRLKMCFVTFRTDVVQIQGNFEKDKLQVINVLL